MFPSESAVTEVHRRSARKKPTVTKEAVICSRTKRKSKKKGRPRAFLTPEKVAEIFDLRWDTGAWEARSVKVAQSFGVAPKTIRDIWNKRTWVRVTVNRKSPSSVAAAAAAQQQQQQPLPPVPLLVESSCSDDDQYHWHDSFELDTVWEDNLLLE